MAGRQGREELIKKGLLEMMERGKWGRHGGRCWARVPGKGQGRNGDPGSRVSGYRGWTRRRPFTVGSLREVTGPPLQAARS